MEKQEKRHREGYHQKEDLAKGEKRKTTAINLFIIREIFKLINNGKLSLGQFYVFLLTSERKYTLEKCSAFVRILGYQWMISILI